MVNTARLLKAFTASNKEAEARYNEGAEQQDRARPRLLKPNEIAGDYDASRLLSTTLGGILRPLTSEDLQVFKRNADALGKSFKGGITAKGLIDLSLPIDRQRSNAQIRVAMPRQYGDGNMHFVTNAGPESRVTSHNVLVQFLNYQSAVSSPSKESELATLLTKGPIRCHCDCERWRYHYSYVATIGKFNAGIPQLGYPKITNPRLVGAGCKHVLRVMQQLSSPMVRQYIEKMIAAGRKHDAGKVIAITRKDAHALARHQKNTSDWKRNTVESSSEKKLRLAQQRAVKAVADRSNERLIKIKPTPAKMEVERRKMEVSARKLAAMGGISQQMLADILAKLKGS